MRTLLQFGVAVASVLAAMSASAQTYRCGSGGSQYLSDRPCAQAATQGRMAAMGPAPTYAPQTQLHLPAAPKAEQHLQYLNPACAQISEAIRTGPARGVRYNVIQSLHEEYRAKCAFDDAAARRRVSQDQSSQWHAQQAQATAVRQQREEAAAKTARCTGMRDVISTKRRREADLNPQEIASLRSLESTYNGTCIAAG